MPGTMIDFRWAVDDAGYALERYASDDPDKGVIQMQGPKLRWLNPMIHRHLFMEFAFLEQTPEACLGFASKFGLLTWPQTALYDPSPSSPGIEPILTIPTGESLRHWYSTILEMAELVVDWEDGILDRRLEADWFDSAQVDSFLAIDPADGEVKLCFRPGNLHDAIKFQFFQAVSDGARWRQCSSPKCDNWFRIGTGHHRADAKTCSNRCRYDLNNMRRAAGKMGERK
jgi:hypothetical protein